MEIVVEGNPQQGLIPFKQIKTIDLSSRNQRNIYYEWKFTMEILCQYYSSKTGKPLLKNPSELQLVDSFDIVKHAVDHFRDETSKKRKRRDCQLKITTLLVFSVNMHLNNINLPSLDATDL
ncbi:hypothetical protein AeMF1_006296 [Aphanomyces euteiches]|nr:hypothetical protein AeMF1_006296 [Aphanomyces euteiches]